MITGVRLHHTSQIINGTALKWKLWKVYQTVIKSVEKKYNNVLRVQNTQINHDFTDEYVRRWLYN